LQWHIQVIEVEIIEDAVAVNLTEDLHEFFERKIPELPELLQKLRLLKLGQIPQELFSQLVRT